MSHARDESITMFAKAVDAGDLPTVLRFVQDRLRKHQTLLTERRVDAHTIAGLKAAFQAEAALIETALTNYERNKA